MSQWRFWEWVAYTALFVAALIIAADQGVKLAPDLFQKASGIISTPYWAFAPLALILLATAVLIAREFELIGSSSKVAVEPIPLSFIRTSLRLQFFGDHRVPQEIGPSRNVATWFAYYSPSITLTPFDAHGARMPGTMGVPPNWAVFITLDKPSAYRQTIIAFSNPEVMPPVEARFQTARSIVVTSQGQIPAGVLQIHVEEQAAT